MPQRVMITAGASGIGKVIARAFAAEGAMVHICDVSEAALARFREEFPDIAASHVNVRNEGEVDAWFDDALEDLGGLDVLVNCAGVARGSSVESITEADWDDVLDINLKGTFFCIQAALPHLRASQGNVVNLASDAGLIGEVGLAVYCASKGGVVNLTRALALELAPDVRVNCVCPGYVDTDMVRRDVINASGDPRAAERTLAASAPLNRIAPPAEIATAILYLASDHARFITGSALQIDGGTTAGHPRASPEK